MRDARWHRMTSRVVTLGASGMIGILFVVALIDGIKGTTMAATAAASLKNIPDELWYLVYLAFLGHTGALSIDRLISARIARDPQDQPDK